MKKVSAAALDRAVREVTTPQGRIIAIGGGGNHDWWRLCTFDDIRARYREIAEREK